MQKIIIFFSLLISLGLQAQIKPKIAGKINAAPISINFSDSLKKGKYVVLKPLAKTQPNTTNPSINEQTQNFEFVTLLPAQNISARKILLNASNICYKIDASFKACLEFPYGVKCLINEEYDPSITLNKNDSNPRESISSLKCYMSKNKRYLVTFKVKDNNAQPLNERKYYIQRVCAGPCPRLDYTIYGEREGLLSFVYDNTMGPDGSIQLVLGSDKLGDFVLLTCSIEEI